MRYALSDGLALHAGVDNLLDTHYATFGTFGDPTGIGVPGVPADPADADPRFQSPAAGRAVYVGLRLDIP
jgi:outer membrane receptor protein involved in Fe transport